MPNFDANATTRTIETIIKNGNHCFKNPPKLTCLPLKKTKKHNLTIFHEDDPL